MSLRTLSGGLPLLALIACVPPQGAPTAPAAPLPLPRWDTALHPPFEPYPTLPLQPGLQGDVVMVFEVHADGQAGPGTLVSGPSQLAGYVDRHVRRIRFQMLPGDGPGPWSLSVTGRFDLQGRVGIVPTGRKVRFEPVTTPPPGVVSAPPR